MRLCCSFEQKQPFENILRTNNVRFTNELNGPVTVKIFENSDSWEWFPDWSDTIPPKTSTIYNSKKSGMFKAEVTNQGYTKKTSHLSGAECIVCIDPEGLHVIRGQR